MNSQNPFPSGDSCCGTNYDMTVDQLLGNAYQVVKFVAMRMPFIKTLSDNIDDLIALAGSLEGLNELAESLPQLMGLQAELQKLIALYNNLADLVQVADNLPQILTVHDNLPQINVVYDNLSQIQTVVANIASIVSVGNNINAVNNVHNNMSSILNVNTNMAVVTDVSNNMVDVRAIATNMVDVKAVAANMVEIQAVYAMLDDLALLADQLTDTIAKFTELASTEGAQLVGTPVATTMVDAVLTVPTIAALRALPVPVLPSGKTLTIRLLGYYVAGDLGGGNFYWQGNSNETDDGGLVIRPGSNPATGRWRRVVLDGKVNVCWFGAKGDGTTETPVNFQKALDCGKPVLEVPATAHFKWIGNGPTVRSNTTIISDGGIIEQPQAHVAATSSVGNEFSGLRMELGFENICLKGLDIRGPYYQSAVTPAYRSIGISVSGRYDQYFYDNPNYPANPDTPVDANTESKNLSLFDLKIDGFGQSAVIVDQVTGFKAANLKITNCCRDGIRCYGTVSADVSHIDVDTLGPGMPTEGIAPNNNAYGCEFTRIYHSPNGDGSTAVYRTSQRCVVSNSKFRNVPTWKGAGTHGGTDISFLYNEYDDCHIGIGIDKGGSSLTDGFAPPRRISIIGNRFRCAGDPVYDNRAAVTCFANDDTEDNIGEDLFMSDNRADGPWGQDTRDGAFVISNYRRVTLRNFQVNGALRSAVNLQNTVLDFSITGGIISRILNTSLNTCTGVNCQGTKMRGTIDHMTFDQTIGDPLTALSTATQTAGYAVVLGLNQKFTGNIVKMNATGAYFDQGSPFLRRSFGWANFTMAGGTVPTIAAARGIASLSLVATGQVRVTLSEAASTINTYSVSVTPRNTAAIQHSVNPVSTTEFDIYFRDQAGTAINSAAYVEVVGY